MKKFLGIVFFGLLLSGCAPNMNHLVFNKTFSERVQLILDRHARVNLFKGDENKIYLNNKFGTMPFGYTTDINEVAQRICVEKFNFETAKHVGSRVMTKTEIEELVLHGTKYEIYKCEETKKKITSNSESSNDTSTNKSSNVTSTNKLNRTFICKYAVYPSEKSIIEIRGSTATETTAIGVTINYSIVNLSNKGAFTLEGSSKQGRAWFIGAQSFLLLDVEMLQYTCN